MIETISPSESAEKIAQQQREYKEAAAAWLSGREDLLAQASTIGAAMVREFAQAALDRFEIEQRWLKDLRQFKGRYDPDEEARFGKNRSKAFVRKTRVKVKNVNARIFDLMFPSGKECNLELAPTPKASIPPFKKLRIVELLKVANDGAEPDPVQVTQAIRDLVIKAAKLMTTEISDQLVESRYRKVAAQAIHSGNLYGTGIIKGPLVERKVRQRYEANASGRWNIVTEQYTVPFLDFVPLWRFYPDMQATDLHDCRFVYERHLLTRNAFRKLASRKAFALGKQKIIDYVKSNPKGCMLFRYHDQQLQNIGDRETLRNNESGLYEVFERWGWYDADELTAAGIKVPEGRKDEEFFCNSWCLPNGELIRLSIQPINGVTWPYHLYYFDKDETSLFGDGIATIMRDDQSMLNAVVRMILDNAAITAGCMLEITPGLLSEPQKATELYPFKVFLRNRENLGQEAVRPIKLPMGLEELTALYNLFDMQGDEVTIVPKYSSGENPTNGAGATASGLSMLMSAQGVTIKDLVVSFDEGISKSMLIALYRWNMQFNPNEDIKGDFDAQPIGSASMMAKELRSQQLAQFGMSITPADEPFIDRHAMLTQRAEANELVGIVKTKEQVEAEQNSEAAQAQAKLAEQQAALTLAKMEKEVSELAAKIIKIAAETSRIEAEAMNKRVDAGYSAMQAGGVAVQSPAVAAAGDELLRAAGWKDATAPEVNGAPPESLAPEAAQVVQNQSPVPAMPGPNVGMREGMNTQRIEDNVNA